MEVPTLPDGAFQGDDISCGDVSMQDLRGRRTLATVLFTDCVGFSARMSRNEEHTLHLIRRDLRLMQQVCRQFEGRVLKSTGDGLLVYFASAVKAVLCAMEIQRAIAEAAVEQPSDNFLLHRIGIHLADLFISQSDVMGNGVNIAARLQSEAEPGGICISQTVYDVAKSAVTVDIQFLGRRKLKNIQEEIPVYKILQSLPGSEALPMSVDVHTAVVTALEQHPDVLRIKKLMLFVCHQTWESDGQRLAAIPCADLLPELLKKASTFVQLERRLHDAARSLSKPTEYLLVANAILQIVRPLCSEPKREEHPTRPPALAKPIETTTIVVPEPAAIVIPDGPYADIAAELTHSEQFPRIKKLLAYICNNRWENDLYHLERLQLTDLLVTLHERSPTFEHLIFTVNRFVQTLSKQVEYSLVANILIQACQPLYAEAIAAEAVVAEQADDFESLSDEALDAALDAAIDALALKTVTPALPLSVKNLFNLRQEIMTYANPLKVKILLVCGLEAREFHDRAQEWLDLKTYVLDDLLRQIVERYDLHEDVEVLLLNASARFPTTSDYNQIAKTLIKCLRPFYGGSDGKPLSLDDIPDDPLEDLDEATMFPSVLTFELDNLADRDQTCQLTPPGHD